MTGAFHSILFDREIVSPQDAAEPAFFGDLHLDQIVTALTAGREEYDLAPFLYRPLHEVEAVTYRHNVLRDLEQEALLGAVRAFTGGMHEMREHLALMGKLRNARQQQRWFLDAVAVYCDAVSSLAHNLTELDLRSRGFLGMSESLQSYIQSSEFSSLVADTAGCQDDLAAIAYTIHIKGNRVRVSRFENEADMSAEIEQTFAKFKRGAVNDHRVRFPERADMNGVEARILDLVARLHPEPFARLDEYCHRHQRYLDDTIGRFDREVQVYVAYLEFIEPLKVNGLHFSYPRISARSKDESAEQTFDLALARKLTADGTKVVCNDLSLTAPERILVVSGPNNGGKTTFARMFGQLHYLASLGLPVPGSGTRLFLPDDIFTHFERQEDIETLRGKFEDELFRIHDILDRATDRSVLIMNESFGSTTLHDALTVGSEVMRQIIELDALCVFVTFVDELASMADSTVSMMSTVVPEDPAIRTFKIVRKRADGLAYAAAIAEKHGLTYDALRTRIAQ